MCVDDNMHNIPPQIKRVPTMIVTGIREPLVGKQIFDWIQKIKFIRQQQTTMEMNRRIIQQNMANNAKNSMNGPLGFTTSEQGSISDTFAYKEIDKALPQSYFGIGEEDKNVIFTAPKQKPMSKAEQAKLIRNAESSRNIEEKKYSELMKKQQLHAVMKSEQQKL